MSKKEYEARCIGLPYSAETLHTKDDIGTSCLKNEIMDSSCCKLELHSSCRRRPTLSRDSRQSRSRHSRSRSIIPRRRLCDARRRELSRTSMACSKNFMGFETETLSVDVSGVHPERGVYAVLDDGSSVSPHVTSYFADGVPRVAVNRGYPWMSAFHGHSFDFVPVMVQIPFMYTLVPSAYSIGCPFMPQHTLYDSYFQ